MEERMHEERMRRNRGEAYYHSSHEPSELQQLALRSLRNIKKRTGRRDTSSSSVSDNLESGSENSTNGAHLPLRVLKTASTVLLWAISLISLPFNTLKACLWSAQIATIH